MVSHFLWREQHSSSCSNHFCSVSVSRNRYPNSNTYSIAGWSPWTQYMWMCNFILTHFATPLSVLFFSEEYFNGLFYTKTNMMKSLRVTKHFVRFATLRGWYQNKTLSDTEFPKTPYKAINSRTHYNDVIMNMMASQITYLTIVYSTVYARRRSRKTSKLGVTGLCGEFTGGRWIPRTKGQ